MSNVIAQVGAPKVWVPNDNRQFRDYNEIDVGSISLDDATTADAEMWMAKQIGLKLADVYPNRQWGIKFDATQGVMFVICPSLSVEKGYLVKIEQKNIEELQKDAVRAAGEILERHGITRNRKFDADIIETLDRDLKDNVVTPDSAPDKGIHVW